MNSFVNTFSDNDIKISVIIPVYNRESVLERAVMSVLDQTMPPLEILIIDNNSTDNTPKIIHDLKQKYSLIRSFVAEKQGASHARNMGIIESKGNWLQFLDSDDVLQPEKFEKLAAHIKSNLTSDVIYSPHKVILTNKFNLTKSYIQNINEDVKIGLITFNIGTTSSNLFKRSIFYDLQWNTGINSTQDYDLFRKLYNRQVIISPFPEVLTHIYADLRIDSLSRPADNNQIKTILKNKLDYLDSVKNMLESKGEFNEELNKYYLTEKNTAIFQFLIKDFESHDSSLSLPVHLDLISRMRLIYHHVQLYNVKNSGVLKYPAALFHAIRFISLLFK